MLVPTRGRSSPEPALILGHVFFLTLQMNKNDVDNDLKINDLIGFVTCRYDKKWRLGCVLGIKDEVVSF